LFAPSCDTAYYLRQTLRIWYVPALERAQQQHLPAICLDFETTQGKAADEWSP
jgi:hypothetical protein